MQRANILGREPLGSVESRPSSTAVQILVIVGDPRIVRFEISGLARPTPAGFADQTANVIATFGGGERKELIEVLGCSVSREAA